MDVTDMTSDTINTFITDSAYTVYSTHHTVLGSTPTAAIFGRDLLFEIPYIADWKLIGQCRQSQVNKHNEHENKQHIDYEY